MIDLSGKVALVTGSSRGIGEATAERLAEAGADVVLNYVTSASAATSVAERIMALGRRVWVVKADISEEEDILEMIEYISKEIGQLDIIVSNAASGGFRPLLESTRQHFESAMATNAIPLISLLKAAMPLLERSSGRAKVIAISSHGSHMALPMYGLVGSTKAALESIVRHLTLEIGDRGVNINVVKAGLVETDSTRMMDPTGKMFQGRTDKTMIGERVLMPVDVANVVTFLASPLSDLVQGETVTVDGGSAIHV